MHFISAIYQINCFKTNKGICKCDCLMRRFNGKMKKSAKTAYRKLFCLQTEHWRWEFYRANFSNFICQRHVRPVLYHEHNFVLNLYNNFKHLDVGLQLYSLSLALPFHQCNKKKEKNNTNQTVSIGKNLFTLKLGIQLFTGEFFHLVNF